jgi:glutaredoxin
MNDAVCSLFAPRLLASAGGPARQCKNVYIVIGKEKCRYTQAAKRLLESPKYKNKFGVLYVELSDLTPSEKEGVDMLTNFYTTVPKVFFNDVFIGGYDKLGDFLDKVEENKF